MNGTLVGRALRKAVLGFFLLLPACAGDGIGAAGEGAAQQQTIERIALGSCADQRLAQPFWEPILASRPDLMILMGDNVYGDVTSAEMRELKQAYADLGTQPGFQKLRASVPVLAIWDDHDYGVNDGGGDFAYRQQAAAIFRAFWQVPADSPRGRRDGLYDAQIFGPPGKRVQVILLDTRSFRSPLKSNDAPGTPGRERYLPDPDPAKTMLGAAQWAWLEAQLKQPAELRLIVSSIQVLAEDHGWERWGNLPAERERLIALIDRTQANGVVFLSGDRHLGALYRRDRNTSYPLYEITSSSLNRPFLEAREHDRLQLSEIFRQENFGLVAIDWRARTLTLNLRDLAGAEMRSTSVEFAEIGSP
jgi:alkaline phosphatase D